MYLPTPFFVPSAQLYPSSANSSEIYLAKFLVRKFFKCREIANYQNIIHITNNQNFISYCKA